VLATLAIVPAERIAENLAFINWTVLTGIAVGSFGAVALGRLWTDATRGYLAFTAVCAVLLGLLAVLSDGALPLAATGSAVAIDPAWDVPRRFVLWLFCGLAAAYAVAIVRGRRAPALAMAGLYELWRDKVKALVAIGLINGGARVTKGVRAALGLAIVAAVARAHGGRCSVRPLLRGTAFRLHLPVRAASVNAPSPTPAVEGEVAGAGPKLALS